MILRKMVYWRIGIQIRLCDIVDLEVENRDNKSLSDFYLYRDELDMQDSESVLNYQEWSFNSLSIYFSSKRKYL